MIVTFRMTFDDKNGIVAWADDTLFDTFSGPGMKLGDTWNIMLGRRIKLDADDLDGSVFIDDLLEETVVNPLYPGYPTWETVRDVYPNVWVTRPALDRPAEGEWDKHQAKYEDYDSNDDMHEANDDDDDEGGEDAQDLMEIEKEDVSVGAVPAVDGDDDQKDAQEYEDPIAHYDEYAASDVSEGDIANMLQPVFVDANVPDDTDDEYDADQDDPVAALPADGDAQADIAKADQGKNEEMAANISSDEPGSDWDSDEELSGDDMPMLQTMYRSWFEPNAPNPEA